MLPKELEKCVENFFKNNLKEGVLPSKLKEENHPKALEGPQKKSKKKRNHLPCGAQKAGVAHGQAICCIKPFSKPCEPTHARGQAALLTPCFLGPGSSWPVVITVREIRSCRQHLCPALNRAHVRMGGRLSPVTATPTKEEQG